MSTQEGWQNHSHCPDLHAFIWPSVLRLHVYVCMHAGSEIRGMQTWEEGLKNASLTKPNHLHTFIIPDMSLVQRQGIQFNTHRTTLKYCRKAHHCNLCPLNQNLWKSTVASRYFQPSKIRWVKIAKKGKWECPDPAIQVALFPHFLNSWCS